MSKVLTVAWRDFTQTVMRKVFLLAVLGLPIMIGGSMIIAGLVMVGQTQPPLIGTVAIVDTTGEMTEAARAEFDPEHIAHDRQEQIEDMQETGDNLLGGVSAQDTIGGKPTTTFSMGLGIAEVNISVERCVRLDETRLAELKRRLRNHELLAVAIIPPKVLLAPEPERPNDGRPTFDLLVAENLGADHTRFIERRLGQAVVRVRANRAGMDADQAVAMLRRPVSNTKRVLESGVETKEDEAVRVVKQMIPVVFMMLLWIAVFTSAQHLMMMTIEEKSNRVMEVLLSAASPLQLMAGKILGQGGVGLLIVMIYSSVGIAGLVVTSGMHFIHLLDIAYLFIFFFMAYFMIASIMAAVGSAVSDIREANTLVTPVMFVVMIPLFLWFPITHAPNGAVALTFSFIPPAIPFVMILRIAAEEAVPLWQIPLSIVWGYACVAGMIWMAAKIFRVGVLMYGKPPTPWQLFKWLRYS